MDKIAVIIVAGGSGSRMECETPKQFMPLAGKPILVHTVERFLKILPESDIIVVLPASEKNRWDSISGQYGLHGTHRVCEGGENRFMSVKNALSATGECDYIMVHDGVRPLVSEELIFQSLATAEKYFTAVPAIEPADSFRIVSEDGYSLSVDRTKLRSVQTPQTFRSYVIRNAYQTGYEPVFTDDASVVEHYGIMVTLFPGDRANIKITVPTDIILAEALLSTLYAG